MSFYVRRTSGGFTLAKQVYVSGKRKQVSVPRHTWHLIGVRADMSIEQARARVQQLNKEAIAQKWSSVRAAKASDGHALLNSVYLPQEQAEAFQAWLTTTYEQQLRSSKLLAHWQTVQRMLVAVQLLPHQFYSDKQKVFNWLRKQRFSLDYSKKLLRLLNLYGEFISELQGRVYKPVGKLGAIEAQRIRDAYFDSQRPSAASEPLTPEALEQIKHELPEAQYRWLYVSIWFGLRPIEVDGLHHSKHGYKQSFDKTLGKFILSIYQPKLVAVAREQRWKFLPVWCKEQEQALLYIRQGKLKRPLNKVLKRLLNQHVTCYGGRKGFIDLMLDKQQSLEDISAWLGHSSIEMSWRKYRNRKRVSFRPPKAG